MIRAPYDARRRPDPRGLDSLTPRECDVLRSFARQGTHKAVAVELGLSHQTIKNYAHIILGKLGLNTVGQAAVIYDRHSRQTWPDVDRRNADRRNGQRRQP